MIQEGATYDKRVVEAIRRIRGNMTMSLISSTDLSNTLPEARKWRVIALTNNFTKTDLADLGRELLPARYATLDVGAELAWLGWKDGVVPHGLREMFDDFCDSSELGMRYAIYCSL